MWVALGTTPEAQLLAQVIPTLAADCALPTGDADLESNTVTKLEAGHLWPNGNDLAR